jgi:2-polyprenyl-3-methyl-5-hydroxy-6-metoxy-1,4-benzoquinol methylase
MNTAFDRQRWDEKHRTAGSPASPSSFLVSCAGELPRGRCLDLAAGRGANSLFMADRGYQVDTIDWSFEGLRQARAAAQARSLRLNWIVADLTHYPLPSERYDVLLCFRFLERGLWPEMVHALRPGGGLVFETFTQEHRKSRPDFPDEFCLAPGELRTAFPTMKIAAYREVRGEETASVLAFRS